MDSIARARKSESLEEIEESNRNDVHCSFLHIQREESHTADYRADLRVACAIALYCDTPDE